MMPDEVAKLREGIKSIIIQWCEEASVDYTSPEQLSACSKQIWIALEESGKLHPQMTYRGFCEAIRNEALLSQANKTFYAHVRQTKDVASEVR